MSSRVQKGGQKFTPVVKPRGRPSENSVAASRKPSSFREPTVESFRAQSVQTNRTEAEVALVPPAPLNVEFLASDRRDVSLLTQQPSSVVQTHKPTSSTSRKDTYVHASGAPGLTNVGDEFLIPTINVSTQDANPSRAVPIVLPARIPASQSTASLQALSVVQQHTATVPPSSLSEPHFTLHSLLQAVAPHSDVSTDSNDVSQQTQASGSTPSQSIGISIERQRGSPAVGEDHPQDMRPSHTGRISRAKAGTLSANNNAVPAGEVDVEGRMQRRRKSKGSYDTASAGAETSKPALRRSSRIRHAEPLQSEAQELSDLVSDAQSSDFAIEKRRKRRRRSSTASTPTTVRGRRRRNPVIFEPDAHPGDELDPTLVTMATICDDTGQGRISSKAATIQRNHLAWKIANKQKRERLRSIMEAKKYGRKAEEDESQAQTTQTLKEVVSEENESSVAESSSAAPAVDDTGSNFNYRQALPVNRYTAQVRIGPNGETIIDEESLFVDRGNNADETTDTYQHVEESDQTKFTNSASYSRKLRSSRWSAEETELFYDALSQFGENYELISYVLPGRDRKACKAKFKTEDRKNPSRINYCLNNRVPYDIQTLARLTGKDFSGPPPEIKVPEAPKLMTERQEEQSEPEQRSGPDQTSRNTRKKSKTPAMPPDDVEIVGDVETFEAGASDI